MSIAVHFGRVVKRIREERGLSQEVLADYADLNRSYVGEVERGLVMPSLATVTKIAKAFNLPTSDLLILYEIYEKSELEKIE